MSYNVMIVDDSNSVRQLIRFSLTDAGYSLLEASDGQEALATLKDIRANMVITDLNMPGLDGIGLLKELRALPAYKYTPIIMLTTESQMGKVHEGKSAGATGWIVKPCSGDDLIRVIKKVLPGA